MLVKERMTKDPVTVTEETTFQEALKIMRDHRFRRPPVVDKDGHLVGIVVEKDLLYASPSPATTLSIFEMHYLLSKLQMRDIMTKRVITVAEDCPLEDAARIMVDNKIGSLPVMRGSRLVGIITETDIFRTFVEMLGGRERGVRVTVEVPEGKGVLAAVTGAISDAGGNIVSLATFQGRDPTHRYLTMKVQDMSEDAIAAALGPSGTIVDMQQLSEGYVPTILGRTSP